VLIDRIAKMILLGGMKLDAGKDHANQEGCINGNTNDPEDHPGTYS